MSTNHEITRNQTYFKSIPETAIVPKQEQAEHGLEEDCAFTFCYMNLFCEKDITSKEHMLKINL